MNPPRDVVELLQQLVRIPSVNPAGEPGTDQIGEKKCAEFVGAFLEKCGARVSLEEVRDDRPNVIGIFPTNKAGKPRIVLAPHTDTVGVGGMTILPFAGDLR